LPKHPNFIWVFPPLVPCSSQNLPSVVVTALSTVLSGASTTGIGGSAGTFGRQSRVSPVEFVLVQGSPARTALLSQTPVPGLAGLPVAEHLGHSSSPVT